MFINSGPLNFFRAATPGSPPTPPAAITRGTPAAPNAVLTKAQLDTIIGTVADYAWVPVLYGGPELRPNARTLIELCGTGATGQPVACDVYMVMRGIQDDGAETYEPKLIGTITQLLGTTQTNLQRTSYKNGGVPTLSNLGALSALLAGSGEMTGTPSVVASGGFTTVPAVRCMAGLLLAPYIPSGSTATGVDPRGGFFG